MFHMSATYFWRHQCDVMSSKKAGLYHCPCCTIWAYNSRPISQFMVHSARDQSSSRFFCIWQQQQLPRQRHAGLCPEAIEMIGNRAPEMPPARADNWPTEHFTPSLGFIYWRTVQDAHQSDRTSAECPKTAKLQCSCWRTENFAVIERASYKRWHVALMTIGLLLRSYTQLHSPP